MRSCHPDSTPFLPTQALHARTGRLCPLLARKCQQIRPVANKAASWETESKDMDSGVDEDRYIKTEDGWVNADPEKERAFRKVESIFMRQTGGLFSGIDPQAPKSLRKAKQKYTTAENEALRRQGILEMAASAMPKRTLRRPSQSPAAEDAPPPQLRRPGYPNGYTPPPKPQSRQGAQRVKPVVEEVPILRKPGFPQGYMEPVKPQRGNLAASSQPVSRIEDGPPPPLAKKPVRPMSSLRTVVSSDEAKRDSVLKEVEAIARRHRELADEGGTPEGLTKQEMEAMLQPVAGKKSDAAGDVGNLPELRRPGKAVAPTAADKVEQIEEVPTASAAPTPQLRRPPSPPQSAVPAEEEVLAATPMPQLQEPSQPSPAVTPEPVEEKPAPAAEPLPQLQEPSQPLPAVSPEPVEEKTTPAADPLPQLRRPSQPLPAVSPEPAEEKVATAAAQEPQLQMPSKPLPAASPESAEEKPATAAAPVPQLQTPSQPSPNVSPESALSTEPAVEEAATAAAPVPQLRRPKPLAAASKRDTEATSAAEPDPISVSIPEVDEGAEIPSGSAEANLLGTQTEVQAPSVAEKQVDSAVPSSSDTLPSSTVEESQPVIPEPALQGPLPELRRPGTARAPLEDSSPAEDLTSTRREIRRPQIQKQPEAASLHHATSGTPEAPVPQLRRPGVRSAAQDENAPLPQMETFQRNLRKSARASNQPPGEGSAGQPQPNPVPGSLADPLAGDLPPESESVVGEKIAGRSDGSASPIKGELSGDRISSPEVKVGDLLEGTIQSIHKYGAFVDLDGFDPGDSNALIHISQISNWMVTDVNAVFRVGARVKTVVTNVTYDEGGERNRVSLSTRHLEATPGDMLHNQQLVFDGAERMATEFREGRWKAPEKKSQPSAYKVGDLVEGTVTTVTQYGAFVDLGDTTALLHISEISHVRVDRERMADFLKVGSQIKALVASLDDKNGGRISISTRMLEPQHGDMVRCPEEVYAKAEEMAERYRKMKEAKKKRKESRKVKKAKETAAESSSSSAPPKSDEELLSLLINESGEYVR